MGLLLHDETPSAKRPRPTVAALRADRPLDFVLALAGLVLAVLILLDLGGPILAPVTFLGCLVLPGWALVRRLPDADPAARVVWTVVMSAAIYTVPAAVMAWVHFWQPRPVAAAILIAAAALIALFPPPTRTGRHAIYGHPVSRRSPDWRSLWTLGAFRGHGLSTYLPWAVLTVALILWGMALAMTGEALVGNRGLLTTFPLLWYVALAVVVALCIWAVAAKEMASNTFLAASTTGLVAMLYASAPMLVSVPRLPWSYKHIAVTDYIGATGQVDPSIDIYNRWPGFFSVSAFMGEVVGYRDAVDYAALAEFGFALLNVVIVLAIARTLTSNPRIFWTATLVFALTNWVNQNYYSPQAFSYTLYLTMCLIALTFLRGTPVSIASSIEGRLHKLQGRFNRKVPATAKLDEIHSSRAMVLPATVAILLLQAVTVVSHQLTPYMAILALFPLFVVGYFRPKWIGPAMAAMAILYLLPNLDYVDNKYGLFSGFDIFKNASYAPPQVINIEDASGWLGRAPEVLSLVVGLLGVAGLFRNFLRGNVRQTVIVAWLAVAPLFWLLGQSYGGEAKFRVLLFALPWLAIGTAWLFWSGPVRTRKAVTGAIASLTIMAVLFTIVYFQAEAKFRVPKADVEAAQWLDARVGPRDVIFETNAFFPLLIGPNYPSYLEWGRVTSLTKFLQGSQRSLTPEGVQQYANNNWKPERVFVVFSDSQRDQAIKDKLFDANMLPALEREIAVGDKSDHVYDNGAVRIYQIKKTG
ncbi:MULTISPECIES: hypothetical protein [unclassified Arthrobacter]|uniref:hypothetical protein n=1 Tax=unclassified Arthrobacter TaxID=235627 RepID=UPI002E0134C9|nr:MULTISPECIES: hypothetical protein [unclassified Arthrobacter]MEC5189759.1 hypothetical protein [Arthrobacter sp. MP_M4]MEC5201226.1 hypothetical protein [Arthrobacter sp. MP_M7]